MSYIGRGTDKISNVEKLDNISFSGSTATFNLTKGGSAFIPSSAECIRLAIDGIEQGNNYTVSGSQITFDFTPSGSSTNNWIYHIGVGVITTPADGTVTLDKLSATGTKNGTTFLAGDNTFKTVSGTTINNNADNRVITGSGTSNTLEGEANLTFDGTNLDLPDSKLMRFGTGNDFSIQHNGSNSILTHNGTGDFQIRAGASGKNLIFYNEDASSERMRISGSNGDLVQGTDSTGNDGRNFRFGSSIHSYRSGTADAYHIVFFNSNGEIGRIRTSGSSTAYNTSSDYRLKENEIAISDGIARLKQLKPYRFNFKADADTTVDGFFAHEVSDIVPEAIDGDKDAINKDGSIKPQAIDQSKLVPLLTSALQEAITKIETLEAKVQALEENNGSN